MARRLRSTADPALDTETAYRWIDRCARVLRCTPTDSPRVASAHRALAADVEDCDTVAAVAALPDLPDWVARECEALLRPE